MADQSYLDGTISSILNVNSSIQLSYMQSCFIVIPKIKQGKKSNAVHKKLTSKGLNEVLSMFHDL